MTRCLARQFRNVLTVEFVTVDRSRGGKPWKENAMRATTFVLATILFMPTFAFAQSASSLPTDVAPYETDLRKEQHEAIATPDPNRLDTEIHDNATAEPADLEDVERRAESARPVIIEPKFDMTPEDPDETSAPIGPDQTDPVPAPGIVIKIPTN